MRRANVVCARQVGDRPRYSQHPVSGADRHAETFYRALQQIHGVVPAGAGALELLAFESGIALTETLQGDCASVTHPANPNHSHSFI